MKKNTALSLIFPIYNFERCVQNNVELAVKIFRNKKIPFELILVNDGSSDTTAKKIKTLAADFPEIKSIDYPVNHGKGYAIRQGMLQAQGDVVFFSDIDLPYGLDPIIEGLKILNGNQADVILVSRDHPESKEIRGYGLQRKIARKIFSILVNLIFRFNISDTQSGLKGFRQEVVHKIFPLLTRDDFSFDIEVLCLLRTLNYRIRFLPVIFNQSAGSTVNVLRDGSKMLISLSIIFLNLRKRKYRIG